MGHVSVEASIYEPIITSLGVYARVGFDSGQAVDLALSMLLIDAWGDNAFKLFSGKPKY